MYVLVNCYIYPYPISMGNTQNILKQKEKKKERKKERKKVMSKEPRK